MAKKVKESDLINIIPIDPKELEGLTPREKVIKQHEHFCKMTGTNLKIDDNIIDLILQLGEE
jgi:hypothetical protein